MERNVLTKIDAQSILNLSEFSITHEFEDWLLLSKGIQFLFDKSLPELVKNSYNDEDKEKVSFLYHFLTLLNEDILNIYSEEFKTKQLL